MAADRAIVAGGHCRTCCERCFAASEFEESPHSRLVGVAQGRDCALMFGRLVDQALVLGGRLRGEGTVAGGRFAVRGGVGGLGRAAPGLRRVPVRRDEGGRVAQRRAFSARLIDRDDNQRVGSRLGSTFYGEHRMLDGDAFLVIVVP
ncbi:hypothetical protein OG948_36375 (plasmid) [Embleya sp. NBC_00888]|uniref:hypothetical protein n=1 Tax=Embleya sp. NBC_00888 TaxID=2975960 RepID=UPI002F917E8E|nr:hypothetical protein OG948_36375 [Embleya sp. NBC_00888]